MRTLLSVGTVSLFFSFALLLLLLLLCLPLFANFLELFGSSLLTMGLHSDVRIQMVQCSVSFLAAVPATLVHALDFFIPATRSLVLLRTRNGYK